jgi:hypothetical protein
MALVIYITCGGHDHRLEVTPDGKLTPLDHDAKMVEAFTSFGAEAPRCVKRARRWAELYDNAEEHQVLEILLHAVVEASTRSGERLLQRDLVLLAYEYADHVAESLRDIDGYSSPERLLDCLKAFLDEEATREAVAEDVMAARRMIQQHPWSDGPSSTAHAAAAALSAGEAALMDDPSRCLNAVVEAATNARYAAGSVVEEEGLSHESFEDGESEEARWQLKRAIEVLEQHGGRL